MNKQYWEIKHYWWVEDFKFEVEQRSSLLGLLQKHPDDKIGEHFRDMVSAINKRIKYLQAQYKKIYGQNFNLRRVTCQTTQD
jgi:hypothetical protein